MNRLVKYFRLGLDGFAGLLLGSMFACFLVQIAFRYLFDLPVGWTIEYVAIAWLWGILFGYAFVARDVDIIRLDILYSAMPTPVQRTMDVISNTLCAGILLWSLPPAVDYINFMQIERTAYLRISFNLLFSIFVPFVLVVSGRCLWTAWKALRGHPHDPAIKSSAREFE